MLEALFIKTTNTIDFHLEIMEKSILPNGNGNIYILYATYNDSIWKGIYVPSIYCHIMFKKLLLYFRTVLRKLY